MSRKHTIISERGKLTQVKEIDQPSEEDTKFFEHPVRATRYHARKQGVSATVAAVISLVTCTIVPVVTEHWRDEQAQHREDTAEAQRNSAMQKMFSRLNQDEKDIAVLKSQVDQLQAVGRSGTNSFTPQAVVGYNYVEQLNPLETQ